MSDQKIVPREPTQAMREAFIGAMANTGDGFAASWRAAYDAAPSAATPAPDDVAALIARLEKFYAQWGDNVLLEAAAMLRKLTARAQNMGKDGDQMAADFLREYQRAEAELLAQQRVERIAELERLAADYYPFVEMLANNRPPRTIDLIDAAQMVKEHKRALAAQDTK